MVELSAGKVANSCGNSYYVSRNLHHSGDARSAQGWRLPAREIEPLVRSKIVALLNDPIDLLAQALNEIPPPDELNAIVKRSRDAAATLAGQRAQATKRFRSLIAEIRLGREQVSIPINTRALDALLEFHIAHSITLDFAFGALRLAKIAG